MTCVFRGRGARATKMPDPERLNGVKESNGPAKHLKIKSPEVMLHPFASASSSL